MKKITIAFLMLLGQLAWSQDGVLDTGFGTGGYFMTAGSEASEYHQMVDGKMMYRVGNKIYRLTTAGIIDTTFGVNGAITMTQPGTNARYNFLVSNNKLYAFSRNTSGLSNYIYYMGRYNMNGTPDTTLGAGAGYIELEQQYFDGELFTTVDTDGNIIAGSTTHSGNNVTSNLVARRFSADGVFQQTQFWGVQFGYNMSSSSIGLNTNDVMRSVRIAPSGNVVFEAGIGYDNGSYGSSRSGYITVTPDVTNPRSVINGYETFYESVKSSLYIDAENNVYVLSGRTRGPRNEPDVANVVYKRNAAGNLYNAFGTSGQLTLSLNVGGYPVNFTKLAVQPDGKILVAGATTDQYNTTLSTKLILARFLPTGTIDTTFGTNGYVQHDIAHPTTIANNASTDIILSADGSDIYLTGFNYENSIFLKYSNPSLEPLTVPDFTAIAPICAGDTAPVLQATSNNGVDGTWSPAVVSNTTTGTYTFTPATGEHATTATLTITVNQPTTSSVTQTACGNYTWAANGTVYTQSGVYTNVTTNAAGCTNTATLNLTINQPTTSTVTETACNSYTYNGTTYVASGIYTQVTTNPAGCSHTTTLNLTIKKSTSETLSATACESYTFNGVTYNASGTYTQVSTNPAGCEHSKTLILTINNNTFETRNETACESYTLNGTTYSVSGTYTQIGTNASGCEKTTTLNLTINNNTSETLNETACGSYTLNGTTYNTSGTYTQTSTNASGCQHTTTLNLTINNAQEITADSSQSLASGATLADIAISPANVVWYASITDASVPQNPLPSSTVLTDNTTYYAVTNAQGCASAPFAVTVSVFLSNNVFDNSQFSLYPNPTTDLITIIHSKAINSVSVLNVLGQQLFSKNIGAREGQIDMSHLNAGTYFVKVTAGDSTKILKVIKK